MSGVLTMSGLLELVQEWQTLVIHERLANRSWDSLTEEQRAIKVGTEYQRSTRRINLEHRVLDLDLPPAAPLAGAELEQEKRIEDLTLERDRLAHELRLLREAVGAPAPLPWHHIETGGVYTEVCRAELRSTITVHGADLVVYRGTDGRLWARDADEFLERFTQLEGWLKAEPASLSSDTPERSGGEG